MELISPAQVTYLNSVVMPDVYPDTDQQDSSPSENSGAEDLNDDSHEGP